VSAGSAWRSLESTLCPRSPFCLRPSLRPSGIYATAYTAATQYSPALPISPTSQLSIKRSALFTRTVLFDDRSNDPFDFFVFKSTRLTRVIRFVVYWPPYGWVREGGKVNPDFSCKIYVNNRGHGKGESINGMAHPY
jgi:hypothetical protein